MFNVQQTTADIEALIDYMREHRWIQGRNFDRAGACCAWGGALVVTDDLGKPLLEQGRSADINRVFYRAVGTHLMEYNDATGRTKDQVITKLQEVLAAFRADPSLLTARKEWTNA